MTKKYCDACKVEIKTQTPFMQIVYPQRAITMDHLKKGGEQPWITIQQELCEPCMNEVIEIIKTKQHGTKDA